MMESTTHRLGCGPTTQGDKQMLDALYMLEHCDIE